MLVKGIGWLKCQSIFYKHNSSNLKRMSTHEEDEYLSVWRLEVFEASLEVFAGYIFDFVRTIDTHRGVDFYYVKRVVWCLQKLGLFEQEKQDSPQ